MSEELELLKAENAQLREEMQQLRKAVEALRVNLRPHLTRGVKSLLHVLATQPMCRRDDIACEVAIDLECCAYDSGTVARAFHRAADLGLIQMIAPKNFVGLGRSPHLVRLTDRGRDVARQLFAVEPCESRLDELMARHDNATHVYMILLTRHVLCQNTPFIGMYQPELIVPGIPLPDGQHFYVPDISVPFKDGSRLLIECERSTRKNREQRIQKWTKAAIATHGVICIVTPDSNAQFALKTELLDWYAAQWRPLRRSLTLRLTNLYRLRKTQWEDFWEEGLTLEH